MVPIRLANSRIPRQILAVALSLALAMPCHGEVAAGILRARGPQGCVLNPQLARNKKTSRPKKTKNGGKEKSEPLICSSTPTPTGRAPKEVEQPATLERMNLVVARGLTEPDVASVFDGSSPGSDDGPGAPVDARSLPPAKATAATEVSRRDVTANNSSPAVAGNRQVASARSSELDRPSPQNKKESGSFFGAIWGFFSAIFSFIAGIFSGIARFITGLFVGHDDPLKDVPLPNKNQPKPKPHPAYVGAAKEFDSSIRPYLKNLSPRASASVADTFPKESEKARGSGAAVGSARPGAPKKGCAPDPKTAAAPSKPEVVASRSEPAAQAKQDEPSKDALADTPPHEEPDEPSTPAAAPSKPAAPPPANPDLGRGPPAEDKPPASTEAGLPDARGPPEAKEKAKEEPRFEKKTPAFKPGDLGERTYNALCWGFSGGAHKELIHKVRQDVREAARYYSRTVAPSLTSHLQQMFLDLEYGSKAGYAAALRLDSGWSSNWYRVGVATARFLYTIDQAEKMIAGVLSDISGIFLQVSGIEIEQHVVEVGLESGSLSAEAESFLIERRRILSRKKAALERLMKTAIGAKVDFSSLVTDEDTAYLSAVAKQAKDNYLTDERTKRWTAQRVEEILALVDEQIKRKAALEALKMAALADKDLDPLEKQETIDKFVKLSRDGLAANPSIELSTESPLLRSAVWESQSEFPESVEALSHMRLARALKRLATADAAPNLRTGFETAWIEGEGVGAPTFGVHLRWSITAALRLLWSSEDIDIPKLEEEIARMNLVQADRDQTYNLERAQSSLSRYASKLASPAAYPDAEDIAFYGRARQVFSIASHARVPLETGKKPSPALQISSMKDLVTLPPGNSPSVKMRELLSLQADARLKKSQQQVNVEVGFGGGAVILDSVLPTLVVTLENMGKQEEAAKVRKLADSLREVKALFETMYSVLQFSNDYLYALERLEAAEANSKKAAGDRLAFEAAERERIEALHRVRHVEAELRRHFGDEIKLPTKEVLRKVFSMQSDQFYFGNPLFKNFNMDAKLNAAAIRVYEDLVAVQSALCKIPEVRIYLTSVLALVLSPAMPWMPVLAAIDLARTGLPLLSALFSKLSAGKSEGERAQLIEAYGYILGNKEAAERLAGDYVRQREALRSMGSALPLNPQSLEQEHALNRFRIATLAYEIAPGAEDFLADRIVAAVEKGDLKHAAELWNFTNAGRKLEANGTSQAGELLRQKLNNDETFKQSIAKKILDSDDWFEAKLLFDPWLKDFDLDFGPALGGRIVKKIVDGYVNFFDNNEPDKNLKALSLTSQLKDAVGQGDLALAWRLYKEQVRFERKKATEALARAGGDSVFKPSEESPVGTEDLADTAKQRAFTKKVIAMVGSGHYTQAQEMLASVAALYKNAGMDFDRSYPGLKKWAVGWASREKMPEVLRSGGLPHKGDAPGRFEDEAAVASDENFPEASGRQSRIWRNFRLFPDWDLGGSWRGVTTSENRWDLDRDISESMTMTGESSRDGYLERRSYLFAGPMGAFGDLRFHAAGSAPFDRGNPWNPLDSTSTGETDSYYSWSLMQKLMPGFDLTERMTMRLMRDGLRRTEYGLGGYGYANGSSNYADLSLIHDSDPKRGKESTHYRSYGRLGYGSSDDDLSVGFGWQADDLYGRKKDAASGEYNLSGRARLPLFDDSRHPEVFWSGTYFNNRDYLTTGKYYNDTYVKDLSYFIDTKPGASPPKDGAGGYAGFRQMLASGKFGGIGMGYAVESDPATRRLNQYRTASYVTPGGKGQIDVINSDDPAVGPAAVQGQLNMGSAMARVGVDASNYTAILGERSEEGDMSAAGRYSVSADKEHRQSFGLSLGVEDSSYQAMWTPVNQELALTLNQGDVWGGNGISLDYRNSEALGDRMRFRLALNALSKASDWATWTPFGPLGKKVGELVGSKKEPSGQELAREMDAIDTPETLSKRAGTLLETAKERVFGEVAVDMERNLNDFRRERRTSIPYSWKPAFDDFLQSLSDLIPQLKVAQAKDLYAPSDGEKVQAGWTPRVVAMFDETLRRYEDYRRAYRDQIWAIPVSGGVDKRPQEVANFDKRSQWFVDYIQVLKTEFSEIQRIGQLDEAALREQLSRLYRLKEETPLDYGEISSAKVKRLLPSEAWLPTTADIPVRVLDNRISRLIAEQKRRQAIEERIRNLEGRAKKSREKPNP